MNKPSFKIGQRIKYHKLRGTIFRVCSPRWMIGAHMYDAIMDNGAHVSGTDKQFYPVRRIS